jgi:zinc transporter, ZIP family
MNSIEVIGLGAIAGATIYLGLPIARLKNPPRMLQGFLTSVATGILIFLLYDVIAQAAIPVDHALKQAQHHASVGTFVVDLLALIIGISVGLLGLVFFEIRFMRGEPGSTPTGTTLGYMIATGIGMHNLSEGLAIGQAATGGALQLAVLLIIGFGLHNATEGFGISAPLAGSASWGFILVAGLIGGGPTFLGTVVGSLYHSTLVFILCLSLAAGSIIYVLSQLMPIVRRAQAQQLVMAGLLIGFTLAYGSDLVLIAAGA